MHKKKREREKTLQHNLLTKHTKEKKNRNSKIWGQANDIQRDVAALEIKNLGDCIQMKLW